MADLVARTPLGDVLPLSIGRSTLVENPIDIITWVAPYSGRAEEVSHALEDSVGCAWPSANRVTTGPGGRAMSVAPGQALVLGADVETEAAAVVDQSDGWVALRLSGASSVDVLSRLTATDLRDGIFEAGHTARTLLGHVTVSLSRVDTLIWEVLVARSMAAHTVEEIARAMRSVAGRETL